MHLRNECLFPGFMGNESERGTNERVNHSYLIFTVLPSKTLSEIGRKSYKLKFPLDLVIITYNMYNLIWSKSLHIWFPYAIWKRIENVRMVQWRRYYTIVHINIWTFL